MRLGELMIAAGWAQPAAVEAALERQRTDRRRLGALLVDGGDVALDDVARGLARQRGVPAALERHLSQRDGALAAVVPAGTATALSAIPVAWSRGALGVSLVVCFRDPTPEHVAELARVTGVPVIPAVACETVIAAVLEAAYPELEHPGGAASAAAVDQPDHPDPPDDDASVDVNFDEPSAPMFSLVDLDDRRVQRDHSQTQLVPARTGSLLPPSAPPGPRIVAPPPPSVPGPRGAPPPTLAATLAAIAAASSGDAIADCAIEFARGGWQGAVVLVVREGLAVGHRGFGGHITDASLASLVIPLGQPSMFTAVHDERRPVVGAAPAGGLVQARFLKLFDAFPTAPMALVPVVVRERVINLVFAIAPIVGLAESASALIQIAAAMGDAYQRVIQSAKTR